MARGATNSPASEARSSRRFGRDGSPIGVLPAVVEPFEESGVSNDLSPTSPELPRDFLRHPIGPCCANGALADHHATIEHRKAEKMLQLELFLKPLHPIERTVFEDSRPLFARR